MFIAPIASANKLLKNPIKRDQLRVKFRVKAVEMEGSGIADATWSHEIGYLVVRGICDYCDSKKGDNWQAYAAAVAAAYTRALLESMPASKSSRNEAENQKPDLVEKIKSTQLSNFVDPKMYILHLSDLHFSVLDQAQLWSKKLLNQYYDANKLLVDCLNSTAKISYKVKHKIKATLLLPINHTQ